MPTKISRLAIRYIFGRRFTTIVVSASIVMVAIHTAMYIRFTMMTGFPKTDAAFEFKFTLTSVTKIGRIFGKQTLPLS